MRKSWVRSAEKKASMTDSEAQAGKVMASENRQSQPHSPTTSRGSSNDSNGFKFCLNFEENL